MQQTREKLGDSRSELTLLLDHNKVIKSYPNVANQLKYQKKPGSRLGNLPQIPSSIPDNSINSINIEPTHFEADPSVYDFLIKMAEEQNNEAEVDWSGYFTRKNKHKVAVDLRFESKMPIDFKEHHLNVCYRAHLEPYIFTDPPLAVGKFKATNGNSASIFQEYIKYFQERQRAGIIQTPNYLIYLIPAGTGFHHQYNIAKD